MEYKFTPVTAKGGLATLQEVIHVTVRDGKAIFHVAGDCMEGRDIMNGGWVAVDFTHCPRPRRKEDGKYAVSASDKMSENAEEKM